MNIQPENGGEGLVTPESGWIKQPTPAYYYHSDHLGSSSLLTDNDSNVSQHIEYLPFGEVFEEERNNNWNTPYKFNAKELDEVTSLYYYGARYFDSRTSVWYGVDPLGEKYPGLSLLPVACDLQSQATGSSELSLINCFFGFT